MLFRQIALLALAASATHGFVNSPSNSKQTTAFTRSAKALVTEMIRDSADAVPSDLMAEVSTLQYCESCGSLLWRSSTLYNYAMPCHAIPRSMIDRITHTPSIHVTTRTTQTLRSTTSQERPIRNLPDDSVTSLERKSRRWAKPLLSSQMNLDFPSMRFTRI
jgi:hypothetical protein